MPPPSVHPSRNRRWILSPNSEPNAASTCGQPLGCPIHLLHARGLDRHMHRVTTSNSHGNPGDWACAEMDVSQPNTASPNTTAATPANPSPSPVGNEWLAEFAVHQVVLSNGHAVMHLGHPKHHFTVLFVAFVVDAHRRQPLGKPLGVILLTEDEHPISVVPGMAVMVDPPHALPFQGGLELVLLQRRRSSSRQRVTNSRGILWLGPVTFRVTHVKQPHHRAFLWEANASFTSGRTMNLGVVHFAPRP